jgi:hypothetical protein
MRSSEPLYGLPAKIARKPEGTGRAETRTHCHERKQEYQANANAGEVRAHVRQWRP